MLVILKDNDTVRLIEDVRLDDGYLPTVGEFKPVWFQDGLPQIEPALWFKTDVISCVLLDVPHRLITWSTQPITDENAEVFRSCDPENISFVMDSVRTHSKLDQETHDLDASYDEMFEAAEYLLFLRTRIEQASSLTKRQRRQTNIPDEATINKIIVKLLHCYLIPCLKIKPADLPLVVSCLKKQEAFIMGIDKELEKKMNDVATMKGALQKKRQTMVENFQNFKDVLTYPKEILFLLESQFQEDIRNLNFELGSVQDEINDLKQKSDCDEILSEKRQKRDEIVGKQVKFIMARENIVNAVALECPRVKAKSFRAWYVHDEGEFVVCDMGKYDMHSALGMYARVHQVLQNERDDRALLIAKKNLLISVREAIRETQMCLEQGEVTTGCSNNKTRSRRATDVLNTNVPDQWLTLSEKVSDILSGDNEHSNRHVNFIGKINDKLLAAVSVAKLAYRETTDTVLRLQRRRRSHYLVRREVQSLIMNSKQEHREVRHEVATLLRSRAGSCRNFRRRIDSIIQMSDDDQESFDKSDENEIIQDQIKNEIRLIQAQIHAHFDMMSSELQISLKEDSEVAYYKIWLCYEVHFYENIMHELIKLYHLSYKLVCSNLKQNSGFVTFQELGVQEKWLADLLAQDKNENPEILIDSDSDEIRSVDVSDVKLKEGSEDLSDSSSESDMDNLNLLVKRLSIYQESPRKYSDESNASKRLSVYQEMPRKWSGESPQPSPGQTELKTLSLPAKQTSVTSPVSANQNSASSPVSTNQNSGTSPVSTNQNSGTSPVSTNQNSGTSPVSTNQNSGTSPLSTNQNSGTSPVSTNLNSGTSPVSTNQNSGTSPVSTNQNSGTSPVSTNLNSGTSPVSTNQNSPSSLLSVNYEASFESRGSLLDSVDESEERSELHDSVSPMLPRRTPRSKPRTLPATMKQRSAPPVRQPAYRSQAFREVFAVPIRTVHAVIDEETPLNKLQLMTKCVRQIQKAVTKLQEEIKRREVGLEIIFDEEESLMCCDDFLTILTLILLHLEPKTLSNLYPHVVMLTDFMAPFLTNGLHSNSLTHFYGAFQIIFSTMVVKNSISSKMVD